MSPYIGKIVLYHVTGCDSVNLRVQGGSPVLPAIVTRVWSDEVVNLHVIDDGPYQAWKVTVLRGDQPGQWDYIPQAQPEPVIIAPIPVAADE